MLTQLTADGFIASVIASAPLIIAFWLLLFIYPLCVSLYHRAGHYYQRISWIWYPLPLALFMTLVFIFSPSGMRVLSMRIFDFTENLERALKVVFIVLTATVALVWLNQNPLARYWEQTYHQPAPWAKLEGHYAWDLGVTFRKAWWLPERPCGPMHRAIISLRKRKRLFPQYRVSGGVSGRAAFYQRLPLSGRCTVCDLP